MKTLINLVCCIIIFSSVISCKKEYSCEGCATKNNKPPIAVAGPDRLITLPTDSVLLDGSSSSDADGIISGYLWTKISGPSSFNIIKPIDSVTKVKTLVAGTYQFELKVTDNGGLSAKDTMRIIVDSVMTTNHPPIANAGADQTITLPTNAVSLNGSASTDPENNITNYAWTKISGPSSVSIANANGVQTQATNLIEGIYQIELKVTDAGGLFSKDTMLLIVANSNQTSCAFQQTIIGTLIKRSGFKMASAGNKIVIAGGFESGGGSLASTKVDMYDIITKTWTTVELSNHGGHISVISAGEKIFFAGGNNSAGGASSTVDIYNASDNTWITANLSEPGIGIRSVKAGNKVLFALGGASTKVDVYDLSSSSWVNSFNLNKPVSGDAIALGDKAVFGTTNGVDIFDASNNSWSTKTFSQPQYQYSSCTLGNKIYLAGGYSSIPGSNDTFSDVVHIYDVNANTWSTTTMAKPKALFTAVGLNGKIFWAGGFDSAWSDSNNDYTRLVNDIEIYDINTGSHSHHSFSSHTNVPQAGLANNHVLFTAYTPLHIYNSKTESWTICPNLGSGYPIFLSIGNTIYTVVGVGTSTQNLTVWKLEF